MRRSLDLPPVPKGYTREGGGGLIIPAKREFPVHQMLLDSPSGPPTVFATWNPSDKAANLTLSLGNLKVTQSTATWDSVRSTISKSSGKWYWEITIGNAANYYMLGIAKSDLTVVGNYPGSASGTSYGYFQTTGQKFSAGSAAAYGAAYGISDVIGTALDMDAGTLIFYKNNTSQGTAFTGLSGAYFACVGLQLQGGTIDLIANFGASALTYAPPAGYNAGLYT